MVSKSDQDGGQLTFRMESSLVILLGFQGSYTCKRLE